MGELVVGSGKGQSELRFFIFHPLFLCCEVIWVLPREIDGSPAQVPKLKDKFILAAHYHPLILNVSERVTTQ